MARPVLPEVTRRLAATAGQSVDPAQALALFDAAVATGEAFLVPQGPSVGRDQAPDAIPPLFRDLVTSGRRRAGTVASTHETDRAALRQRLTEMDPARQVQAVLELVYEESAAVLGMTSVSQLDRDKAFMELGFDSLTSVELRNRLADTTGLQLSATLVFDTGTPTALADQLYAGLSGTGARAESVGVEQDPDSLEAMFLDALKAGGKDTEIRSMIKAVAAIRPSVEVTAELPDLPWPVVPGGRSPASLRSFASAPRRRTPGPSSTPLSPLTGGVYGRSAHCRCSDSRRANTCPPTPKSRSSRSRRARCAPPTAVRSC